jgi:CRP-like cAMP-binding protein
VRTPYNVTLAPMVTKLSLWSALSETDRAAILALPFEVRQLKAGDFIAREGDRPRSSCLMLSGYSIRHKYAGNGGRQIFSIHMRGDIVDLHNSLLRRADHNVEALIDVQAAFIPIEAIKGIAQSHPTVGDAMWYETLVDGSIFREWTLNVGRRDGRVRTAHMLCEFAVRLSVAGLGERSNFELPMTQDQLSDVLGMTNVHTNRMLKNLTTEGLIERTRRSVRIIDFERLAKIGDFNSSYLHLDRAA